jgi:hypothetical protein
MMATLAPPTSLPLESDELLLITHSGLRAQLLKARLVDDYCARCIIQRGESVYLSLHEVPDAEQRQSLNWAVLRLQMGAQLSPQELPEPLRTALSTVAAGPSPLIMALIWGLIVGVVGGVMVMAIVGLAIIILNVSVESYVGITATAVSFVLSGAFIGLGMTIYFWRKFTRQPAIPLRPLLRQRL